MEKNPNLAREIIEEELSGVFNWVLEGLKRILEPNRKGFTYSKHIDNTNKRIERNSNSVALFMCDENLQPSSENMRKQRRCMIDTKTSVKIIITELQANMSF